MTLSRNYGLNVEREVKNFELWKSSEVSGESLLQKN